MSESKNYDLRFEMVEDVEQQYHCAESVADEGH
jgi:hypothetical protein